jgi:hypothetical protein
MTGNLTIPKSHRCFFCNEPAHIELGRDSFLVDCEHCHVSYEINDTAWVAGTSHPEKLLAWVRYQMQAGQSRPVITIEHTKQDPNVPRR